jgi:NADH dehydrogenase (ubiquinone) 1 alpha subcomplex subunit 12
VVYADKFDYNPTSVPPEWHGWLNYINDYEPNNHQFKKPIYQV